MTESVLPNQGQPELASRVRSAVFWRAGSQFAGQILGWASTIIVINLLSPGDYGLFAMTQVMLTALNFLNGFGFATSLVQEKTVTKERIAQVFGLIVVFNVVLAAVQFLTAPWLAGYFHQPLIIEMLRVQCLMFALNPFIALPSMLLSRRLEFRKQARVDMLGAAAGAVTALGGAYAGWGYWTLVIAPMVQQTVRAIGLSMAAKLWMWPSFNFKGIDSIKSFGSALIFCQFLWVIQSQADAFIAGHVFTQHELGLYTEALFVTLIFTSKFIPALNDVSFPAYTQLAKEGGDVGQAFLRTARLLMFVAAPFFLGLSAVSDPFVHALLEPKWAPTASIIAGLSLVMPFFSLQIICSPTTNALGKPKIYVLSNLCGAILMTVAFLIGVNWGQAGLVRAWQIGMPILLLVTLALTLPVIKASWQGLIAAIAPSLLAALAMYAVVEWVDILIAHWHPLIQLALLVPIGAAIYLGLIWFFARHMIEELLNFVTKKQIAPQTA